MDIFYYVERFGLNFSATQLTELDEQFLKYQLLKETDIAASVWEDVEVKDGNDLKYYRMDLIWGHLAKQKTIFGKLEFDLLLNMAELVLVLPHSHAGEERVFSMVQKNKTEGHESLGFNTLGSILIVKMSNSTTFISDPVKMF